MKETYRVLPVYAGDVSGACSALYELGGMTVMHDPSGCNSTYNTFDETRWYDKESLIFLSGLTDMDAVMGNDQRLIRDVLDAAEEFHPAFIALVNSPIPFLNGTDFAGICRLLETKTGIPAFYIPTNGMHDYTRGASLGFLRVAQRLVDQNGKKRPGAVNILGMTPLDFAAKTAAESLSSLLESEGWRICSNWSLNTSLEEIRQAGCASVNLVVSSTGLETAKHLERAFQTPWVAGVPVGDFARPVLDALKRAEETGRSCVPYFDVENHGEPELTVIGEPVQAGSLAAAYRLKHGGGSRVVCPTELTEGLLGPEDPAVRGEEQIEAALSGSKRILADPIYRPVCPADAELLELPHLAISGRMYRTRYPDLFLDRLPWE